MKETAPKRKRGRGRRIFMRFSLLTLALVALGFLGRMGALAAGDAIVKWLAGTSWSELKQVEVVGLDRLLESDVITRVALPKGSNLMHIRLDSVEMRVAELPGVREARAYRRLPGKLVIRVEERIPVATIAIHRGGLILVDREGFTFPQVHLGEVVDLPVITGNVESATANLKTALAFLSGVERSYNSIHENLGEIRVVDSIISIRLKDGATAIKGIDLQDEQALANLDLFLEERGGDLHNGVTYVDMKYPSMIITGTSGN